MCQQKTMIFLAATNPALHSTKEGGLPHRQKDPVRPGALHMTAPLHPGLTGSNLAMGTPLAFFASFRYGIFAIPSLRAHNQDVSCSHRTVARARSGHHNAHTNAYLHMSNRAHSSNPAHKMAIPPGSSSNSILLQSTDERHNPIPTIGTRDRGKLPPLFRLYYQLPGIEIQISKFIPFFRTRC